MFFEETIELSRYVVFLVKLTGALASGGDVLLVPLAERVSSGSRRTGV